MIEIPWIAKVYRYPFARWSSFGRQALFGFPFWGLFLLFQKLYPGRIRGRFSYHIDGEERLVTFNVRNTQFLALYLPTFAMGYEPHITALINELVPQNGVFYDIGSNWGWFALHIASRPGFKGVVHAFEPFPPSFHDLDSLIVQARLAESVRAHQVALSDVIGSAAMRLPDHFQSGQAVMVESRGRAGDVRTATLDSLELEPPDVIKMDVEGAEARVFRGGVNLLREHKPMLIFEHGRGDDYKQAAAPLVLLRDLGYELFQVCWLRRDEDTELLIGEDIDADPRNAETLALLPFVLEERFVRSQGMNIFACHKDKLSSLKSRFEERVFKTRSG